MTSNQTAANIGDTIQLTCEFEPESDISAKIWFAPNYYQCLDGCFLQRACNIVDYSCHGSITDSITVVINETLFGNWTCYVLTATQQLYDFVSIESESSLRLNIYVHLLSSCAFDCVFFPQLTNQNDLYVIVSYLPRQERS